MLNIVLFGPPGAGKGTQANKLIDKYGLTHVSTGDIFRWHMKNDSPLGQKVKQIINDGNLVPDKITIAMLKEEVNKNPNSKGFLFDGFPRTVDQASALDNLMESLNSSIDRVIELEVSETEVRTRIAKRREVEDRPDDEEEKLNKRISEYFDKTIHVLPYYREQGRLASISGVGEIEAISQELVGIIDQL